jgi:hypothetical protein
MLLVTVRVAVPVFLIKVPLIVVLIVVFAEIVPVLGCVGLILAPPPTNS